MITDGFVTMAECPLCDHDDPDDGCELCGGDGWVVVESEGSDPGSGDEGDAASQGVKGA